MSASPQAEPLLPRRGPRLPGAPALLIGTALAGMLAFTWRTWPDPVIDTGRELYTAWRIAEGDALYRDVAYFHGPLSPHFNAVAMQLLGPSLDAVMLTNGLLLVAIIVALYQVLRLLSDRLAATAATMVCVAGFATLRLVGIGNYTFVTPYSHELTHGTLLLMAMLLFLTRHLLTSSRSALALAGVCAGLACLTKPEIAAAAMAGLLIPLALDRFRRGSSRDGFLLLVAIATPILLAFALLLTRLPAAEALAGLTGPFRYALSPTVRHQPFYRQVMLGSDVRESLAFMAAVTLVQLALVAAGVAAGALLRRRPRFQHVVSVATAIFVAAALLLIAPSPLMFMLVVRSAPLLLPVAAVLLAWFWWRARDPIAARPLLARLALVLVASVLLVKIALTAGPQHYGFALAMPAAMVLTLAGLSWLPEWLEARGTSGNPLRAVVLGIWAATLPMLLVVHAHRTSHLVRLMNAGTSSSYYAEPRGVDEALSLLAGFLIQRAPPAATVAVLEQGAWLNFLAQRRNSTPYVTLLPPEVAMFGSDAIAVAYEARPPEYVVRIPFSGRFDYQVDGLQDYAPRLDRFMRDRYVDATPPPLQGSPVKLLRRNSRAE